MSAEGGAGTRDADPVGVRFNACMDARAGKVAQPQDLVDVDALLGAGLIVEGPTGTAATGGRRRRTLAFNVAHSQVLVAALDTTHARVALTDLEGRIHAESRLEVDLGDGPPLVLDAISAVSRDVLGVAYRLNRSFGPCRTVRNCSLCATKVGLRGAFCGAH